MASNELKKVMSNVEKTAWRAIKMIVEGLFGNHRRDDMFW